MPVDVSTPALLRDELATAAALYELIVIGEAVDATAAELSRLGC